MKLVIGGSTGYVATEVLSQALKNPTITSIIALGRREAELTPETGSDAAKLKVLVCDNFGDYPDNVKAELENADACIWTIAITPIRLNTVPWEETCKVSRDYATTAIKTLDILRQPQSQEKPLRFLYMSGHLTLRSRDDIPAALRDSGLIDYGLLRGEAETLILNYAEQSHGAVQSCIVKPGLIDAPGVERREIPGIPHIELTDIAAAMLDQVIGGFEKDTLSNDDLARIGQRALVG
ncbi:uncharacterized protein N7496_008351 [Penicillium cataractarum]|uniref:NAD(P)-binding domain-containing protein n=1 Tax=Penicillium cataractarum TaxID=2100454 RepID=A0A9W9V6Z3_9EURO|nr:uncharacterized protein N7496_008351 [Penicillium cataractarum]KAJ5368591.1 hypothetical protein N7496_008351 [Penicillium cataractarum]